MIVKHVKFILTLYQQTVYNIRLITDYREYKTHVKLIFRDSLKNIHCINLILTDSQKKISLIQAIYSPYTDLLLTYRTIIGFNTDLILNLILTLC